MGAAAAGFVALVVLATLAFAGAGAGPSLAAGAAVVASPRAAVGAVAASYGAQWGSLAAPMADVARSNPLFAAMAALAMAWALAKFELTMLLQAGRYVSREAARFCGHARVRADWARMGRAMVWLLVCSGVLVAVESVPRAGATAPPRGAVMAAHRVLGAMEPAPGFAAMEINASLSKYDQLYLDVDGRRTFLSEADALEMAEGLGQCVPAMLGGAVTAALGGKHSDLKGKSKPAPGSELTLADSGAGKVVLASARYAKPGTVRRNTTAVSTVNGTMVPEQACDARLPVVLALPGGGSKAGYIDVPDAIIVPQCAHNLVPIGALARTHGLGLTLALWSGDAVLSVHNDKIGPAGASIPLLNMGVLVFPSMTVGTFGGVTHGAAGATDKVGYETLHARAMHRGDTYIANLSRATSDSPEKWGKLVPSPSEKPACDACLKADKKNMPPAPGSHAPVVSKAGELISFDCWTCSVAYRWGGAQKVFNVHDHYSGRNFPYLIKSEAECPGCLKQFFALCKADGVDVCHAHTDNAKIFANEGVLTETCRRVCKEARFNGVPVHFTTCCEYTPRQNGVCERQWQVLGADCRKQMSHCGATRNLWWDCLRSSCDTAARLPIPGSPDETPYSRWWPSGKKPRFAAVVRTWGCICYPKIFHPESKVHDQSVRCMNLGRAGDQPGWRCLDPRTGIVYTCPHVDFVEDCYPGITIGRNGREQIVPPNATDFDPAARHAPDRVAPLPPCDPTLGTAADPATKPAAERAAPAASGARAKPAAGPAEPISQRLARQGRGMRVSGLSCFGAELADQAVVITAAAEVRVNATRAAGSAASLAPPPSGPFVLYLCSGPRRGGDLAAQLALQGIGCVCVDTCIGGAAHDMTSDTVTRVLQGLAADARCVGVMASFPCSTWSAARYEPGGPPVLRDSDNPVGFRDEQGRLPSSVLRANALVGNGVLVLRAAAAHGAACVVESPAWRGKGSPAALVGRETHASMLSYPPLSTW